MQLRDYVSGSFVPGTVTQLKMAAEARKFLVQLSNASSSERLAMVRALRPGPEDLSTILRQPVS